MSCMISVLSLRFQVTESVISVFMKEPVLRASGEYLFLTYIIEDPLLSLTSKAKFS